MSLQIPSESPPKPDFGVYKRALALTLVLLLGVSMVAGSLYSQLSEVRREKEGLQSQLSGLQSEFADIQREVNDLLFRLDVERVEGLHLRQSVADLSNRITQLLSENRLLISQNSQLRSQISQLEIQLARLKRIGNSPVFYDSTTVYLFTAACCGSMEPTIRAGDITLDIRPRSSTEIQIGDIIVYYIPVQYDYCDFAGLYIHHRIVRVSGIYYYLKGDNNSVEDNCGIPFSMIEWKTIGVIYG